MEKWKATYNFEENLCNYAEPMENTAKPCCYLLLLLLLILLIHVIAAAIVVADNDDYYHYYEKIHGQMGLDEVNNQEKPIKRWRNPCKHKNKS